MFELIDFGDIQRVASKFAGCEVQGSPRTMHTAFTKIWFEMVAAEKALFRSKGRRGGGSWAQLKAQTIEKKGNARILYTAGSYPNYSTIGDDALYKSLTSPFSKYMIFETAGYEMEFGTSRPNAGVHMTGTKNMPARPFLKFTRGDINSWRNIMLRHLLIPFRQKVPAGLGNLE